MPEVVECASPFCNENFVKKTHNQKYHQLGCKRDVENVSRRREDTSTEAFLRREAEVIQSTRTEEPLNAQELVGHLRVVNQRLSRENAKLKLEKYEFHEAFRDGAYAAVKEMKIPPIPKPTSDKRTKVLPETACMLLSDWQLGKKTVSYGVEVCQERVGLYMDKTFRISDIQRHDHPVQDLHTWVLGDMVEGEAIFPSQAHHIEASLNSQVMKTAEILANTVIRRSLNYYDNIHFVGIAGNHGAIGGKSRHELHPETNADRLVYTMLQLIFEGEKRITWDIPQGVNEGDFYTIDQIGDKKVLLLHGHQIRGAGSIPTIERKIINWCMALRNEIHFDYIAMGHFHNSARYTINDTVLYINGTTESSNGWAVEVIGKKSRPNQYLFYMHPEHGVTAEYPIYLDHT